MKFIYSTLISLLCYSFLPVESLSQKISSEAELKKRFYSDHQKLFSHSFTYDGFPPLSGVPENLDLNFDSLGLNSNEQTHAILKMHGLTTPVYFLWDSNFREKKLLVVRPPRYKGDQLVVQSQRLEETTYRNFKAYSTEVTIDLPFIENEQKKLPEITTQVLLIPSPSMFFYRPLDFMEGTFMMGDQDYKIALLREPGTASYTEFENISLAIDLNRDGIFQNRNEKESKSELFPTKSPFQFKDKELKAQIINPIGNKVRIYETSITSSEINFIEEGFPMPFFSVKSLENGNMITSEQLKGKITVINWWFTTCPPCIAEIPELNALRKEYENNDDVIFLAIALNNEKTVRSFLANRNYSYSHSIYNEEILNLFGPLAPRNIVLDKQGVVVFDSQGKLNDAKNILQSEIKQLLDQ